jgi:hypothetical protein
MGLIFRLNLAVLVFAYIALDPEQEHCTKLLISGRHKALIIASAFEISFIISFYVIYFNFIALAYISTASHSLSGQYISVIYQRMYIDAGVN